MAEHSPTPWRVIKAYDDEPARVIDADDDEVAVLRKEPDIKRTPADLDINEWCDFLWRFKERRPFAEISPVIIRIENTPFTSARYAGGMIYNGAMYTYFEPRFPGHEPNPDGSPYVAWLMVRDDFLRFVKAELNKEAKRARAASANEQQPELWEEP